MNTTPCRCTTGGAGGKLPWRAGTKECIPNPPKTKTHIARTIQKEKDGRNLPDLGGAAAAADSIMAGPLDDGTAYSQAKAAFNRFPRSIQSQLIGLLHCSIPYLDACNS
jgi:hypothetical protein